MAESSYVLVYDRIIGTREGRELSAKVAERISSLRISDVSFVLVRPDGEKFNEPARAVPRFHVSYGSQEICKTENGDLSWLEAGRFFSRDETKALVGATFGSKVPTYFCKKSVVTGEDSRKGTSTFHRHFDMRMQEQHGQLLSQAVLRIAGEVKDRLCSEEIRQLGTEFLVKSAIQDIKAALGAYSHLGKDVLKEAIDEYLVHSICED